ncbi:MAG: hypothetical protein OEY59_09035 [Deltaproteobacteria bacterium]|nr:hypothetical protein [Deltaproteobacteria bacterium]
MLFIKLHNQIFSKRLTAFTLVFLWLTAVVYANCELERSVHTRHTQETKRTDQVSHFGTPVNYGKPQIPVKACDLHTQTVSITESDIPQNRDSLNINPIYDNRFSYRRYHSPTSNLFVTFPPVSQTSLFAQKTSFLF